MFKRPSSRRKTQSSEVTLNLVPMLDALVTLVSFLLYTMTFFAFVSVESPAPVTSSADLADKLKEKPLQLTVSIRPEEIEIWSPFQKIKAVTIANNPDGQPNLVGLHERLLEIKKQFPAETKVVLAPYTRASYDVLVAVMDAARVLEKTDAPIFAKNAATGTDEPVRALFPDVIFGNLLGDS